MKINNRTKPANIEMQEMLGRVYDYNFQFVRNKKQEGLLRKIIEAMKIIDRKFFVSNLEEAYIDTALGIGEGQTISQPSTVARMLMLAEIKQGDSVLEVGSGSGWNACLIYSITCKGVVSIDRILNLVKKAKNNVKNLKKKINRKINIKFLVKNIFDFSEDKFDKIIITAGISNGQIEKIREVAKKLLSKKGILVCPRIYGNMIILKKNNKFEKYETDEEYVFVPLVE